MCRIALVHNAPTLAAEEVHALQCNGGNRTGQVWARGGSRIFFSRLDVTTTDLANECLPLAGEHFEIVYNGEVFGFRGERFSESPHPSDIDFALDILETYGIEAFFRSADLQGTFLIRELATDDLYILADQLNTCGAFYAAHAAVFVFGQEVAVVDQILKLIGAPPDVAIHTLPNGSYLRINVRHSVVRPQSHSIRSYGARVFEGNDPSIGDFWLRCEELQRNIFESTIRRLPQRGPIAILCGGGVDSSCIVAIVVNHLRRVHELDRLRIYCFSSNLKEVSPEADDLLNTRALLDQLRVPSGTLVIVGENERSRRWLYETKVFCDVPRLITPNPVLNTQVRHSVRMSLVLAEIVKADPDVRVVLTGDVADEVFAGYHSMRIDVKSAGELADRVKMKLQDLPLNDAARFTLASLYGTCALIRDLELAPLLTSAGVGLTHFAGMSQENLLQSLDGIDGPLRDEISDVLRRLHPVEIRTPFSSHDVLKGLQSAHPDSLVGSFDGRVMPKFLLRVAAHRLGVPGKIASRGKIPFNEGGSGVRNDERDDVERRAAASWGGFGEHEAERLLSSEQLAVLLRLNLLPFAVDGDSVSFVAHGHYEQLAVYQAARRVGLDRLINDGSTFRPWMPDCVYSTDEVPGAYVPRRLLAYDSSSGSLMEAGYDG